MLGESVRCTSIMVVLLYSQCWHWLWAIPMNIKVNQFVEIYKGWMSHAVGIVLGWGWFVLMVNVTWRGTSSHKLYNGVINSVVGHWVENTLPLTFSGEYYSHNYPLTLQMHCYGGDLSLIAAIKDEGALVAAYSNNCIILPTVSYCRYPPLGLQFVLVNSVIVFYPM